MNWYKTSQVNETEDTKTISWTCPNTGIYILGHMFPGSKTPDVYNLHAQDGSFLDEFSSWQDAYRTAIEIYPKSRIPKMGKLEDNKPLGDIKEAAIGGSTSPSPSVPMTSPSAPMSQEVAVTPRQIYTRDDVIQEREDLAPSRLRKKKKKKIR